MRQPKTPTALTALLCLSAIACGDKKDNKNNSQICKPNLVVNCEDVPPAQVNNQTFVAGLGTATCSSDGKSWDTSSCTPISQGTATVNRACNPDGDDCASGLTCYPFVVAIDAHKNPVLTGRCFQGCSGDADCSNAEVCNPAYTDIYPVCSTSDALRDARCGFGAQCEPTLTCVTSRDPAQECKELCPLADIGTASGCSNGEKCLQSTYAIPLIDESTGNIKTCSTNDDCAQDEYKCFALDDGNGCIRVPAVCATATPPLTTLTDAYVNANYSGAMDCGRGHTSQFCDVLTNTGATVPLQCVNFYGVYFDASDNSQSTIPCTDNRDCDFEGGFSCVDFGEGDVVCAAEAHACIAFCEDITGASTGDCGEGLACALPPAGNIGGPYVNIDAYVAQFSGNDLVRCATTADCNDGFTCSTFSDGMFCIRPRKVCQVTG